MKGIQLMSIVPIAVIVIFYCVSCNGQKRVSGQVDIAKATDRIDKFALNIILLTIKEVPELNAVISPFSIWTMLVAITEGARRDTERELLSYLRLSKNRALLRKSFEMFHELEYALNYKTPTIELGCINSIYVDNTSKLEESYLQTVKDRYFAFMEQLDFKNSSTVTHINKRIATGTRGRIKLLVNEDDLVDGNILITNALYYKGQWANPFDVSLTTISDFYDTNNRLIGKVNMMHQRGPFSYGNLKDLNAYCVKIPYEKNTHLAMYILLPYYNVSLEEVMKKFENIPRGPLFRSLEDMEAIDVSIPKFRIILDLTLNKIMNNMGFYRMFDPIFANLSGMTGGDNDLYVSRVIQKAQFDVTEEGIADPTIKAKTLSNTTINNIPKVEVNRPFLYFIVEERFNLVLLGGSYVNPQLY